MKKKPNTIVTYLVVFALAVVVFTLFSSDKSKTDELSYSQFNKLIKSKQINSITITNGKTIEGTYSLNPKLVAELTLELSKLEIHKHKDHEIENNTLVESKKIQEISTTRKFKLESNLEHDTSLLAELRSNNPEIQIKIKNETPNPIWGLLPILILAVMFMFFMRKRGGAGGDPFTSKDFKVLPPGTTGVTFADVAGLDQAKIEVVEVIEYLKDPSKILRLGGKPPSGILLVGPPGTGKTLLAKAIATESTHSFISVSGSEFIEKYVGVGGARIRKVFAQARQNSPCIVFIDEIDAIGSRRTDGEGGGNAEQNQTLNQLLTELDGFDTVSGVTFIAATNRYDKLDEALKRDGRFDRTVNIDPPHVVGREEILKVHLRGKDKKIPLASDVDPKSLAKGTPGYTGAQLANLVNEAVLHASRRDADEVAQQDFESAKDKMSMGPERKNLQISEKELIATARHEAGHTLINMYYDELLDPVHKVSIVPRTNSLGVTVTQARNESAMSYSKTKCKAMISMLLGGWATEFTYYEGDTTSGVSNDLQVATNIARQMVYNWGMSDVGTIKVAKDE